MRNYYEEDQKLYQSVASLIAGDMDSYYVMYDLSVKYIYKIIYDIVKDYHTTEDLVQETYLTVYNKINTLQDPSKFYAWAGRIATNLTLRYIQKNNRELLTLDSEDGASEFAFEVAAQDNEAFIPENIVMDAEKQRIIAEIVDGLSVEQKITVQYFYYEEMSVTEIAEAMGCSRGTVMSRLNYARKALKVAVVEMSENMNTPLYSLSALPLFYVVFRETVAQFAFAGYATAASAVGASAQASEGAKATGMAASSGGATAVGEVAASTVAKGVAGKVGASLGLKIAAGVVATGLAVTGGVAIHKAVKGGMEPKKIPMVIYMESVPNTDTVDIFDDTYTYEYINVTYNDEEITIGYDDAIYEYGIQDYEALSPELEQLHEEEFENVINTPSEDLGDVFGDEIEFTIDEEEFTLYVEDVQVENGADGSTSIIITGECETPENVEDIFAEHQEEYENTLNALEEEALEIQTQWDAKNEIVREYYMGVLQDFYLYNTDPFGNKLEYYGDYASETSVSVEQYAIHDVDGDGLVELIVRHDQGEIVYGYNPDTQVVVEEYKSGGGVLGESYDFYDTGYIVSEYYGITSIVKWDESSDVYNAKEKIWSCIGITYFVYGEIGSYMFYENLNNPDYIAQEEELLNTYDKDGDGQIWIECEYTENHERVVVAYYDNAEYETKLNQVMQGGKKVELEFIDINTIAENVDMTDMGNDQYMKIVEDFYLHQTDPFGNYYEHNDNVQSWAEIYDYAICDVDGDGIEELIIRYGRYLKIYQYDESTMQVKEEFSWEPDTTTVEAIDFYENGYYITHGHENRVRKIDSVSLFFQYYDFGSIQWNHDHGNDSITDEEYLALYDKDGDGVIYYVQILGEDYRITDLVYYDNAELEAKISEVTGGSKPLDIEFIDMSTVVNQ
ncbi:MAG: sigma-70 family RNA polymerase sigma factor [Lachnospiraceae bacterium]|nr:sigma-70 family RNA polymerase sigma factor [Lachnospiraceae bacterium]